MGKINQLSFAVANLIAAGEVVDRPASVVKELLENSIDAGADNITVEIARGGVSLIRICDNGCGMSDADLPLALKRHATSKISCAEDLDSILTLGFRGEALAAISAVSDVKIISKTKESELGHLLTSPAGGEVEVCEVGCADGTTVIVENLFSNVPARRKFLKKDVTEAIAVTAVVEKIALSRPDISFTYIIDGQRRFSTAGDNKIKNAIYAVLGRDFANRLVEVNSSYEGIGIRGFVGRSDNCRANRNMQNFFINGRFVKSKTATAAIEQAYSSYIAEGKFPVCVLFIDLAPASVDVNVHPAKLEVKFSNEKAVFESVYYSVRTALENHTQKSEFELPKNENRSDRVTYQTYSYNNTRPTERISASTPTLRPATNAFAPMTERKVEQERRTTLLDHPGSFLLKSTKRDTPPERSPSSMTRQVEEREETSGNEVTASRLFSDLSNIVRQDVVAPAPAVVETVSESIEQLSDSVSVTVAEEHIPEPYRIIGVCFNTYILVEQSGKLLLIDKHAAHERIIFEQLKSNLRRITHASQMMLLPIEVRLSSEECTAAIEYTAEIVNTGFEFSLDTEKMTARIDAIPDMLSIGAAQDLFVSMLSDISSVGASADLARDAIYERALYQSACKAAVKGGRADSDENIAWICDTLMKIPDIKVCPHGRPVLTELDKRYIDRQFERIK